LKWQLHWVSGWAPEQGEYRAVMTDNYGHADVYRGHIDGDRLIFESVEKTGIRLRFTWDASDPDVITSGFPWRNEMSAGEGSWFLIEEYSMAPGSLGDGVMARPATCPAGTNTASSPTRATGPVTSG
jgi:hypothetical protein